MTAVTPGSAELLAKRDRLLHAATTMANDDMSKPGTMERHRLIERDEAIRDAAELLERLAAKPADPDAINEKRAAEDAKLASNVVNECARFLKLHATEMRNNSLMLGPSGFDAIAEAMKRNPVLLSTTGKPKP